MTKPSFRGIQTTFLLVILMSSAPLFSKSWCGDSLWFRGNYFFGYEYSYKCSQYGNIRRTFTYNPHFMGVLKNFRPSAAELDGLQFIGGFSLFFSTFGSYCLGSYDVLDKEERESRKDLLYVSISALAAAYSLDALMSHKITKSVNVFNGQFRGKDKPYASSGPPEAPPDVRYNNAITFGLGHGGGSVVGVDLERRLAGPLGIQLGAGIPGAGCAVNWYFRSSVNGPAISLWYWDQSYFKRMIPEKTIGLAGRLRSSGIMTSQLGLGYVVKQDLSADDPEAMDPDDPLSRLRLMITLGWYVKF